MKKSCSICLFVILLARCCVGSDLPRESDFNFGWKFALQQEDTASGVDFNDLDWRNIRLARGPAT